MRRPLSKRKCKHCQTFFDPDPRSAGRQRYCSKPACRQASKAASQRRWLQKPDNRDYFTRPDPCRARPAVAQGPPRLLATPGRSVARPMRYKMP